MQAIKTAVLYFALIFGVGLMLGPVRVLSHEQGALLEPRSSAMKGYTTQIELLTLDNEDFRRVLYTARSTQLVLMALKPGEEIGEEVHEKEDQFIRVEAGEGEATIDGVRHRILDGSAVIIPAGARHNVVNTGAETLKLYTLYSPPHHRDGVVHRTKAEAQADDAEHFDGRTSETR